MGKKQEKAELQDCEQRRGDRRKASLPFDGPDRRVGDRRKGADRRQHSRRSIDQ